MTTIKKTSAMVFMILVLTASVICQAQEGSSQPTIFSYQGNLTVSGTPANGTYDIQLALFDAFTGGTQLGISTQLNVTVTNGIFSATFDFGNQFNGAQRFIEIRVRQAGGGSYTVLASRQPVLSTPYAIRSITTQVADLATTATSANNSQQLGGVPAANFVQSGAATINAGTQFSISGSRIISAAGTRNTFVGIGAGTTTPNAFATDNSFLGFNAGSANTTGAANSFFGSGAGQSNTDGGENSFFGTEAGQLNSGGDGNSFFGRSAGKVNSTGSNNSFFGATTGDANTTGSENSFFGRAAGGANTTGSRNSFFGRLAGQDNLGGFDNSFFGYQAGQNSNENNNSFFGSQAGRETTSGGNNSFFGMQAGLLNTTGSGNSIFGVAAGSENTIGADNSFFGVNSGRGNTTGNRNTFIGRISGRFNTVGNENTFIGFNTASSSITGNNNTAVGASANISDGLSFATVIGSGASVSTSDTVVIGRTADRVLVRGDLEVDNRIYLAFLSSLRFVTVNFGGDSHLCYTSAGGGYSQIGACSSSIAGKTNVNTSALGLEVVKQLRPVTFTWKHNGQPSIGLIAEEVNNIDPQLATSGENGVVNGVRWNGITVALINSIKEQQSQIESLQKTVNEQQARIEQLSRLVCEIRPDAEICRPK